jgi:hypothetical protein
MTKNPTLRFTATDALYGLPTGTLDAVWTVESGRGTNRGPSRSADGRVVGARGHFQFMPDTAAEIGRQSGHDPFSDNPEEAAKAAGFYLKQLRGMFDGDIGKALAAYNAGPGRVRTAVRERGENWLAAMPSETRNYVPPTLARLNGSLAYQQAVEDNGGVDPHTAEEREAEEARRREMLRQSGLQQSTVDQMSTQNVMGMLFFAIVIALFSGNAREVNQNVAAGLSQSSPASTTAAPSPSTTTGQPAANPPAPAATETPAAVTPAPAAGQQAQPPQPTTATPLPVVDTSIVSSPGVTPRGSTPAVSLPPSGRLPSSRTTNP